MTGIIDGQTNSADDVNTRWETLNGEIHVTFIDTTDYNIKTITLYDSAGVAQKTETLNYVSIYEISNMNSTTDVEYWAESSDANNPTYQTTITYVHEGTGSGAFSWTNSANTAIWTNSQSYGDLSGWDGGYFSVWSYITAACYAALDTNGIRIRTGSDSSNYDEFYFAKADLREGWNYLECDIDNADATEGTADYSACDYLRITVYETASETIYFDNFKIYDYNDTEIAGSTHFLLGQTSTSFEGKTCVETIRYGGTNYGGQETTGGF